MVVVCDACGSEIEYSENSLGKSVQCPKCSSKIHLIDRNKKIEKTFKNLEKIFPKLAEDIAKNLKFKR